MTDITSNEFPLDRSAAFTALLEADREGFAKMGNPPGVDRTGALVTTFLSQFRHSGEKDMFAFAQKWTRKHDGRIGGFRVMGNGFSDMELHEALDAVKDRENWKMPIDSAIPDYLSDDVISEAIGYFCGSIAQFYTDADGVRHVTAAGYYMSIGS